LISKKGEGTFSEVLKA
jgi:renal tumor antigen